MPQPTLMPWLADLTSDSSMPRRGGRNRLKVKVSEVATGGEGLPQTAFHEASCEPEPLKKVKLMFGEVHGRPCRSILTMCSF